MRDILEFNFDAKSHMGRKPRNNEDYVAFHVPPIEGERVAQGCLFIVADGVGGAEAGEYASQFAAEKVIYEYYNQPTIPIPDRLITAIQMANREVFTHALDHSPDGGMATTLVAALLVHNQLYVANVGDSRAYLISQGGIQQISKDHNLVGEMIARGVMTEEAARQTDTKNQLTRCIGAELDVKVDLFGPLPIQKGDRILLCSDGLTRYATHGDLIGLAGKGKLADDVIRLVSFAIENGGADNISMILVEAVEKATETVKYPIKHIGRTKVYRLPLGAGGPLAPTMLPEGQPGAGEPTRRKGAPWLALALASLAVLGLIGWFFWSSLRSNTAASIDIPLTTQAVIDQTLDMALTDTAPTATQTVRGPDLVYQPGDIRGIDLSPDGSLLVVGSMKSGINLVKWKSRIVFLNIPEPGVTGVAFINNKAILSGSQDGSIYIWGGETWSRVMSKKGHTAGINAVAYSPSADLVATASDDKTVAIWSTVKDPASLEPIGLSELNRLQHTSVVKSIAFAPDGKTLLTGAADGSVMEWDLGDYQGTTALSAFSSPVITVAYSGNGKCVAAASVRGEIRSVCRNQGVVGGENLIATHTDAVTSLTFSPVDAALLASGSNDQTIKIWENFYDLVFDIDQKAAIEQLRFTQDGKYLIAAWSNDGIDTLTIWTLPYKPESTPTLLPVLTATPTRTPKPTDEYIPPPPPPEPTLIVP
jgi:serine/threonine protein phosphatase PrpC